MKPFGRETEVAGADVAIVPAHCAADGTRRVPATLKECLQGITCSADAIFAAHLGGDIRRTLQCVVTSPEFFSRAAYRSKVKTPFELVVSSMRALGAVPDDTPRAPQVVARLGQPIFGRQTPDGWPDRGDEWLNTGAMVNRVNFGLALASDAFLDTEEEPRQVVRHGMPNARAEFMQQVHPGIIADCRTEVADRLRTGAQPVRTRGTVGGDGRRDA